MVAPAPSDNTDATPVSANRKRNSPTNPLHVSVAGGGGAGDVNLIEVAGAPQTPRDWSADLVKLQNLDLALTALRDAMRGAGLRDLTELWDKLDEIRIDVDRIPASPAQEGGNLLDIKNRLPAALRTGRLDLADAFTELEALEDQAGAGGVLTFTFTSVVQLVWVRSIGAVSRAIMGAQTPTATLGVFCADDEPTPIVVNGSVVKVFAPVGATKVAVYGCRYS